MDTELLIRDFAERIRSTKTLPILHPPYGLVVQEDHDEAINTEAFRTKDAPSLEAIVRDAALGALGSSEVGAALKRITNKTDAAELLQDVMIHILRRNCALIVEAAKAQTRTSSRVAYEKAKIAAMRKSSRKRLADELRDGRRVAREIRRTNENAEERARAIVQEKAREMRRALAGRLASGRRRLAAINAAIAEVSPKLTERGLALQQVDASGYPEIPDPSISPHKEGEGLPESPGIYFLWDGNGIYYVGQSIKLSQRLRLGHHHILSANHRISFVHIERQQLTWAECYYIGLVRPKGNFGRNASHYEPDPAPVESVSYGEY